MPYQSSNVGNMLQGGGSINLQGGSSSQVQSPITISAYQPAAGISVYQPAATADVYENSGSGGIPIYTGGGGSQQSAAPAYVDPWAGTVFGSTAGYNKAVGDYGKQRDSMLNSINDATVNSGNKYNSSILDYLDSRKIQQNTINSNATQNELARQQGMSGIMDMVGNGVGSSGTLLGNKNAGSSSAGEAIARAYGTLGRQQASGVGNQFARGQEKIATDQGNLLLADETQKRHANEDKTSIINEIVNNARSQISALNSSGLYASLPGQLDIEAKAAEIRQNAINELAKYDSVLTNGISGQAPMSAEQIRARATSMLNAGTAPEDAFNYTTEFPAQFQGTGQFPSSLPIFVAPRKDKQ